MPQGVPNLFGSFYQRQREAATRDIAAVVAELVRQGSGGPTSAVISVDTTGVGFYQEMPGGAIYWSRPTKAHLIDKRILDCYRRLNAQASVLGYPLSDNAFAADGVGMFSHFEHGSIYWTPRTGTGAHEVYGAIRDKWAELGWEQSYLGYPKSGEQDAPGGGRISYFEHGYIRWQGGSAVPSDPPSAILRLNLAPTELIPNTLRITGVTWVVTPRWAPGSSQTVNGANATVSLLNPPPATLFDNIVDVHITASCEVEGDIDGIHFPREQFLARMLTANPHPLVLTGANLTAGWLAVQHLDSESAWLNVDIRYQGAQ